MLVLTIISAFLCFFFQETYSLQAGCATEDSVEGCCTSALTGWYNCSGCGTKGWFFVCICNAGRYSYGGTTQVCISMCF